MGLLGGLLKKGIRDISSNVSEGIGKGIGNALGKAVESAVRPAADKLAGEAAANINEAADALSESSKAAKENRSSLEEALENLAKAAEQLNQAGNEAVLSNPAFYEYDESDTRSAGEKIAAVLAKEFPQYTVKTNVSPATLGGSGKFMNYSFGIYEGSTPKLFIMLIGKTTCSSRLYRWSKEQAEKAGVMLINFIEHYPNRPEYITVRLHQYI